MSYRCIRHFSLIAVLLGLSSCAYMQTHKNIEEASRLHTGYHLQTPLELYRAGGQYYLAVEQQQLRVHYPTIHDSIFLNENNDPWFSNRDTQNPLVFLPISKGTAEVLQLQDGYAELSVLSDELKGSTSCSKPSGAQRCPIRATVEGTACTWIDAAQSEPVSPGIQLLSAVDRVLIDWPGTVVYNAAIPVMAPFVFFYQFLNED